MLSTHVANSRVGTVSALAKGMRLAAGLLLVGALAGDRCGSPSMLAGEPAYCSTTPGTTTPFYPGPSASSVYDQTFTRGVPITHGPLRNRYTPQGLTGWTSWDGKGEDVLLVSGYHDGDGDGDADGPSAVYGIVADGPRAGTSLGRMLVGTGHVGGIAVYAGRLYVAHGSRIDAYRLSTVRAALSGASSDVVQQPATSRTTDFRVDFLGTGDHLLWAGTSDPDEDTALRSFTASRRTGALAPGPASHQVVPRQTQGVAVTAGSVIFSTSYGRHSKSTLWIIPRQRTTPGDTGSYCFEAPSMTEGLTVLDGRLHVAFESGAYTYTHPWDNPRNVIEDIHRADLGAVTDLSAHRADHRKP